MNFPSRFIPNPLQSKDSGLEEPLNDKAASEGVLLSRREALRLLFSTGTLAALGNFLPGCDLRHQNFDVKDYPRLTSEPQSKTETPLEDAQIMALLTDSIQSEFGFCPDFSQFFSLSFDGQKILIDIFIAVKKDPLAAEIILKKAGFDRGNMTIMNDGVNLVCDKNGQHLDITINMNSKIISINGNGKIDNTIKSDSVDMKLYPLSENQEKPIALAIDITHTKTYKNDGINTNNDTNNSEKIITKVGLKPYTDSSEGADQSSISSINKSRQVIGGDGSRTVWDKGSGNFQFQQAGSDRLLKISDAKSLIQFLHNCQSMEMIRQTLTTENAFYNASMNREPFFKDIDSNETIREILGLISKKDLDLLSRFMNLAFVGQANDRSLKEEYRDPMTTLQSGWGDCDDYAVINAFWSYLHGYKPFFVHIDGVLSHGKNVGHIFVWYMNEDERIVVLDNTNPTVLEQGKTVQDYIQKAWPGGEIIFNEEA